MTLGYKSKFTDGTQTYFKEKLLIAAAQGLMIDVNMPYIKMPLTLAVLGITSIKPKIHSIRDDEKDRWRGNMLVHHVYGNRTAARDNFLISRAVSTQRIQIMDTKKISLDEKGNDTSFGRMRTILIDGKFLRPTEKLEQLAINDGFNSLEHFFTWFPSNYSGKIIHFTKLRY
ncbi:MAG: hypothetical protein QM762_12580 [Chryseolinea sp.]